MSSGSDVRGLWNSSSDPTTRFLTSLANKLTKLLTSNQVAGVENDNEDIYSNCVDVESAIKFHTFSGQHLFEFDKEYYPTFEPDYDKLKCWIRARNAGNSLRDLSGFNNDASVAGDPILVDGKFDQGMNTTGVKSLALRLNRPNSIYENQEYISIRDSANIQTDELVTGFSEFMRFKIYSLQTPGGLSPTLWCKIDDSSHKDCRVMKVQGDGRLIYMVIDAGTIYAKQTVQDLIIPNTFYDPDPLIIESNPYDVVTTYNASTHAIKIYLNGVDQTLTDFIGGFGFPTDGTLHDLNLFRRGYRTVGGHTYGDFYDYRVYMEKIVTQQEVTNLNTNKWTIYNIPFGQVAVCDHAATYTGSGGRGNASFSSVSFDPLSFDVADE